MHESHRSSGHAPGHPGIAPHWAPAAKSGVGCALGSRLWFTLGRGIITELFYPRIDQAAIRGCGFLVTDGQGYFADEQTDCASDTQIMEEGIPGYVVRNTAPDGRFSIHKEILIDPTRDVLMMRVRFVAKGGRKNKLRLFAVLSPRLGDQGMDNTGWLGDHRGWPMLFGQREDHALSLASTAPWAARSVGFVGKSDPYQQIREHGHITHVYERAERGHIGLGGEIDLKACKGEFLLAISLNDSPEAAALKAVLGLNDPFEQTVKEYIRQWRDWHKLIRPLDRDSRLLQNHVVQRARPDHSRPHPAKPSSRAANLYRTSMMVLRTHRAKEFAGAGVASLSTPWGEARGDDDMSGYHLIWSRDLVEEGLGLLAGGDVRQVRFTLDYLRASQMAEGGWVQNMWLSGKTYQDGTQMDEAALPIILLDRLYADKGLSAEELETFWPMVRKAATFIIRSGPVTGQDRWENTPGLSPYTLATEIAALLIAAKLADRFGEKRLGAYFRETADLWNDAIEPWTYVTDTALAQLVGVEGYYVRIAPTPGMHALMRKGRDPVQQTAQNVPASDVVSPDALALVRFGLRSAKDPRIVNTTRVIDALLKRDLPAGPSWRRYVGDDYGEHPDGQPFAGNNTKGGIGRCWPLLTGERGHYEVACRNFTFARKLLAAMGGFASQAGMLPEQVWDEEDIPEKMLFRGRPSGSAMPLAWAHSEYVRLVRSLRDKRVFDQPTETVERYVRRGTVGHRALWRFDHQSGSFFAGQKVRIEVKEPAVVRFTMDEWKTHRDIETRDTGFGLHYADLPTRRMKAGEKLSFTFCWHKDHDRWEGHNFHLEVEEQKAKK